MKRDRGSLASRLDFISSLDMNVVIIKLMFNTYNMKIILIMIKKTRRKRLPRYAFIS